MLADTTPTHVNGALEYLLTQGVLGVMCVLLIGALVWTVRSLLKSKDDRVKDQQLYSEALHKISESAKELTVEINKSASDLAGEVIRSNEATRITVGSLEKSVDKLNQTIDALKDEQVRLGSAIKR